MVWNLENGLGEEAKGRVLYMSVESLGCCLDPGTVYRSFYHWRVVGSSRGDYGMNTVYRAQGMYFVQRKARSNHSSRKILSSLPVSNHIKRLELKVVTNLHSQMILATRLMQTPPLQTYDVFRPTQRRRTASRRTINSLMSSC